MDYKHIYTSNIFESSQCIYHENAFVEILRSMLKTRGYRALDNKKMVWSNSQKTFWLAMVDDIESLNFQNHDSFLSTLTPNDYVITDAWINRPTPGNILSAPVSWFGIYSHEPSNLVQEPTKQFSAAINRIDFNRMHIWLHMDKLMMLDHGHAHFNCATHSDNQTVQDKLDLWSTNWKNFPGNLKEIYASNYKTFQSTMPWTNHDMDLDTMLQSGLVNVVIETYIGDHAVSLSEKTFRALALPRPWRLFAGSWAVARLQSLGFDCMQDIIDHDTDGLHMKELKVEKFVTSAWGTCRSLSWSQIKQRCEAAARHNQAVMKQFRTQWPQDCAQYLFQVSQVL